MSFRFPLSRSAPIVLIAVLTGIGAASPSVNPPVTRLGPDDLDTAIFAGGSFWCLERAFELLQGVDSATAGYIGAQAGAQTGGQGPHPDFESVSKGNSSYVQAVRVVFRPARIGYGKLVDAFWKNIDPTRADGQFSDQGAHFRTAIFYLDAGQKTAAESSRKRLIRSKRFSKPIVTEIIPATVFYAAEPGHQDYYKRSAPRYRAYVKLSGREAFLRKAWGPAAAAK